MSGPSILHRLLSWLVLLHLLAICLAIGISYVNFGRQLDAFNDERMRRLAEAYADSQTIARVAVPDRRDRTATREPARPRTGRGGVKTLPPAAASMRAVPSPSPEAPPVTMNTLPSICIR